MLIYEPNMFFLEFFTSPPMEEPWAKVTKPFTTMPIYKASILFLNGQVILINYFFNKEYFSFYDKENPCLPHQGKTFPSTPRKPKPKLIRNLRQYSTVFIAQVDLVNN